MYKQLFLQLGLCLLLASFPLSANAESSLDFLFRASKDYSNVRVKRVYSADSFVLEDGEKIKLIGLNAPKTSSKQRESIERDEHGFPIKKPVDQEMPIEEQSVHFLQQLIEKQSIRLEIDVDKNSEDFYTLAYAFLLDGTFVNTEVLRHGFANLQINPLNKKYNTELRRAYQEARQEMRGLQNF